MERLSVVELRQQLAEVIDQRGVPGQRFIVHRRDKDAAAIISIQDLELLERLVRQEEDRGRRGMLAREARRDDDYIAYEGCHSEEARMTNERGSNPYRLAIAGAARRRLAKLPKKDLDRIDAKIRALAGNPRPHGVKKLTDSDELYRVRVGDPRIVYTIDDPRRTVAIEDVRGRDDIYRKGGR